MMKIMVFTNINLVSFLPPERYNIYYYQYLEYPMTNIEIQNKMIGIGDQICKYIIQRIIDNKRNKEDVKK